MQKKGGEVEQDKLSGTKKVKKKKKNNKKDANEGWNAPGRCATASGDENRHKIALKCSWMLMRNCF